MGNWVEVYGEVVVDFRQVPQSQLALAHDEAYRINNRYAEGSYASVEEALSDNPSAEQWHWSTEAGTWGDRVDDDAHSRRDLYNKRDWVRELPYGAVVLLRDRWEVLPWSLQWQEDPTTRRIIVVGNEPTNGGDDWRTRFQWVLEDAPIPTLCASCGAPHQDLAAACPNCGHNAQPNPVEEFREYVADNCDVGGNLSAHGAWLLATLDRALADKEFSEAFLASEEDGGLWGVAELRELLS